jgi:hypothetical protein
VLQRLGWHCTDCWRAEREEYAADRGELDREDGDKAIWLASTDGICDANRPW